MKGFTLRKGVEADLPQIVSLLVRSWQENYASFLPREFLSKMDVSKQIDRHRTYLRDKATYFIVEEKGELVGFTSFGLHRDTQPEAKWELYTLYVDIKHHRKGLGKALLTSVCREIVDMKSGLAVWVMEENPFRAFYERQGFILQTKAAFDFGGFEVMNIGYLKKAKLTNDY